MFGFVKRNTLLFKDPYSRLSVYSAFVRSRDNFPREGSRSIGLRGYAISSTPFGWSSTYSQFDCTIIKWNDDLNLPIKIRTDTLRKVLNSTYDHARPTSTLDVENSSSTISADWQPARGLPAVNSNRNHSGNNGLKICFQNISGMRTKTQSVFMNTSQSDYDIIILVVRMNSSIRNYSVFRRDRDFGRMNIPN